MWPVLAFHLGPPAPHLVHGAWWSTTNCHWLALRGRVCPHIPLIDSWSSRSAQVSPRHISLDLTHNMVWNINLPSQVFPSIGGVKKEQPHGKLKRCERELGFRLFMRRAFLYNFLTPITPKTQSLNGKIMFIILGDSYRNGQNPISKQDKSHPLQVLCTSAYIKGVMLRAVTAEGCLAEHTRLL